MRAFRTILLAAVAFSMGGCAPILAAMAGFPTAAPPHAPAQVQAISRAALDFAFESFDAALYGLDALMDSGIIKPGSPQAKQIAAAGRKVMGALGAADAARKLGNEPSYNQAFVDAKAALGQFRQLIGAPAVASVDRPLSTASRAAIVDRAAA